MPDWKTIDSAPWGTPVLVYRPNAPTKRMYGLDGRSETTFNGAWANSRADEQPTHWMPLHSPPEGA